MAKNNLLKNILLIGGIVVASTATIGIIKNLNKPGKEPSISINGTYKVNFYRGDEKVFNSQEIKEGECATDPGAPATSDTKVFKGWMTEGDVLFDFSTPITKDTNLFANFVYVVSFNANGGTGTLPEQLEYKTTKKIVLPECNLTKTGETFKGWRDGLMNTYQPGDLYIVNETVTFTAMWSKTVYNQGFKVTYKPGEHGVDDSKEHYDNTNSLDNSIKLWASWTNAEEGYVFDKWLKEGTTEYYEGGSIQYFTSDTTLVAIWKVAENTETGMGVYSDDSTAGIYFPHKTDGSYSDGEFFGDGFDLKFNYVVNGNTITFTIDGKDYSCEFESGAIKTSMIINYNGVAYNFAIPNS